MVKSQKWKRWTQPILVPAVVFVVVTLLLTIATRQLLALQDQVRHTQEVKDQLTSILSRLQEGESSMRAYILLGDDTVLKPYRDARDQAGPALTRLEKLTSDNPVQVSNVAQLRALVTERLEILKTGVDIYKPGLTLPLHTDAGGLEAQNKVRDLIAAMLTEEDRLLAERRGGAGRIAAYLQLLAYATLFIVLTVATFSLAQARRRSAELEAAQEALRATNDKLSSEIQEREKIEDQLRQVQKMEAIGQLTGGIAHDFNNMLAVIIGALNIMQRRIDKGDTNVKEFMKAAIDGAMRGGALTQRLLAFARKQVLEPRPLDANKLVSGMSDLLRRTLGETVQTEVILAGGLWRVHVDANQLETVILNLVVNARDAMPEGGRLTIETANAHLDEGYVGRHVDVPTGQYVLLCVSDTGTGMLPEVLEKAFDPFFTTKGAGRGTGLGLSQVYGFVRQSGGHVKIYSESGQGTAVKIYLPRYLGNEEVADIKVNPVDALPQGRADETVLVVEDEDAVRVLTVEGLRDLGYTVLEAAGGEEALRLLDKNPSVTLLFTDVVMPHMNGRQLVDEACKRRPSLKVLFTTGYTRNAVVHNGTLDPDVRLLGKPFTLEHLARTVRDVLDGR